MRMPEMDGATLLQKVQQLYPQVVRIVLSGHAELETALRAVPVAHQFLTKPSEPGAIESVVERACSLQQLIGDEAVQRAVGRIHTLPSLPRVYTELTGALADETVSIDRVASILKQDMAMCAKILQLVNSAFFRLARVVSRIEDAVRYLGFNAVKQLALAVEVYKEPQREAKHFGMLETLQFHSMRVATLAAAMFTDKHSKEDAFVAGLLHDIGKLLLAAELPEEHERVVLEVESRGCTMREAEEHVLGVSHAEMGAYLLGIWGLPYPVVEAVANHHVPRRVECGEFGLLAAVHIADYLVNEQQVPDREGNAPPNGEESLDDALLDALGVTGRLAGWRQLAAQQGTDK
jgi:putative nucleotidyltransferase with HDIG domain